MTDDPDADRPMILGPVLAAWRAEGKGKRATPHAFALAHCKGSGLLFYALIRLVCTAIDTEFDDADIGRDDAKVADMLAAATSDEAIALLEAKVRTWVPSLH